MEKGLPTKIEFPYSLATLSPEQVNADETVIVVPELLSMSFVSKVPSDKIQLNFLLSPAGNATV